MKKSKVSYKNPFRKWHFTKYILEKKKINELCQLISKKQDINEPSKVIVGFGDWSNPHDSIIRGHKRGPVLKLKKHLRKWCKVIDVNEFRHFTKTNRVAIFRCVCFDCFSRSSFCCN